MGDKELILAVKNGGQEGKHAVDLLISSHQGLMGQIKQKLHLGDEDIKDAFSDSIASLIWNIKTNKFKGDSKISTYLYRILSNKSIDLLRKSTTNINVRTEELSENFQIPFGHDLNIENSLDLDFVKTELNNLGDLCKAIIMDWAYWGYSMGDIANRNELPSADHAKKQKYSCLQKLRSILKTKGYMQ